MIKRVTNQKLNTLQEISKALDYFNNADGEPGLLTGYCGGALFYAYYYRFTGKKKYLDKVYLLLEKMLAAIAHQELAYGHCNGISGMAWCLQHLTKQGIIEQEESQDLFDEVDEFLFEAMIADLEQGHHDFLHQGLGITLYFCDKTPHSSAIHYVRQAVAILEKTAVSDDQGLSWPDRLTAEFDHDYPATVYNLGLSHGVPAIISILGLIYEKNIAVDKLEPLITRAISWLLSSRNKKEDNSISLFPRKVTNGNKAVGAIQSRLGWCYGDLGIALALWNTGLRLENARFQQEALYIFDHTIRNRTKENGNVYDACLCHGSMGISHIYRRMHLSTGDPQFLNEAENWLSQTLQMATWNDGPAGFKYRAERGYENNYSLLDGITGIGLGLMASVDKDTAPDWDRCLLIS